MSDVSIRRAQPSDARLLWRWVNDPVTRASAFRSEPIAWEDHVSWLEARLEDPHSVLYIVEDSELGPVAQARFDRREGKIVEIDVSVAPEARGHGYGVKAICLAVDAIRDEAIATSVVARIKSTNTVSRKAFRRAGFDELTLHPISGHESVVMSRQLVQSNESYVSEAGQT